MLLRQVLQEITKDQEEHCCNVCYVAEAQCEPLQVHKGCSVVLQVRTARVPGAQPSDAWQRGSLRSSHAMMVESALYGRPLMELTR